MIMLELITEVPSCHWWSYLHHQLLKNGNSEVVYEPKMNLKSMSGWFNDTPKPKIPYGGGWISKNNWCTIYLPKDICVFWIYFYFWIICWLFNQFFTKHMGIVLEKLYLSYGTKENTILYTYYKIYIILYYFMYIIYMIIYIYDYVLFIHIYIYTYVYIYTYIYIYICICIYIHIYVCVYVFVYVSVYVYVCTCMWDYVYIYIYVYVYLYLYMWM